MLVGSAFQSGGELSRFFQKQIYTNISLPFGFEYVHTYGGVSLALQWQMLVGGAFQSGGGIITFFFQKQIYTNISLPFGFEYVHT